MTIDYVAEAAKAKESMREIAAQLGVPAPEWTADDERRMHENNKAIAEFWANHKKQQSE
ncbi:MULTISPECIES: hypothetical protein [Actinoplanes]|uniref:hypothetical protein n=1 Tax=Actinoplanes TaxID=1865 RepID=UPI000B1B678D|nr:MULTISPECIES: hypothetical protein [Actinoplanes]GLY00216.1 hypothetical protein Acsp01_05950 [Actinoplanes sp. NBRC 101535]